MRQAGRHFAAVVIGGMIATCVSGTCHAATEPPVGAAAVVQQRVSLFDPERHMRVAEVKRGMTGYGLTVFHGTTIERFEVEVVDVIRNFAPGSDAILIMAKGEFLQHVGGVAGMSGSPIYLQGEDGKHRLAGAFAFGWRMAKDPIAGVQPIEYMLDLADPEHPRPAAVAAAVGSGAAERATWRYTDHFPSPLLPAGERVRRFLARRGASRPPASSSWGDGVGGVSWVASGVPRGAMEATRPLLLAAGLSDVRVSSGASAPAAAAAEASIEPGSSLVVPLMTGDMEMAAVGTCTEVIGNRVFGFGHPFNGEGGVRLPMGAGYVTGVIANLESSFKIGGLTKLMGVLKADTSVGVGGTLGGSVPMTRITVRLAYADGSVDRTLRFEAVKHPNFTPLLAVLSAISTLQAEHAAPSDHMLDYRMVARFDGGRELVMSNRVAGSEPMVLISGVGMPLMALSDSPFGRMYPESIETTLVIEPGKQTAELVSAKIPTPRVHPGQTLPVIVTAVGEDGSTRQWTLPFELPADLDPGEYELKVSDANVFTSDEIDHRPGRFFARSSEDMMAMLQLVGSLRGDRTYMRLSRGPDGLAVGRTSLPRLPASLGTALASGADLAGLPAAPTLRSEVKVVPVKWVVSGSASARFTVEAEPGRKPRAPAATTQP